MFTFLNIYGEPTGQISSMVSSGLLILIFPLLAIKLFFHKSKKKKGGNNLFIHPCLTHSYPMRQLELANEECGIRKNLPKILLHNLFGTLPTSRSKSQKILTSFLIVISQSHILFDLDFWGGGQNANMMHNETPCKFIMMMDTLLSDSFTTSPLYIQSTQPHMWCHRFHHPSCLSLVI